MIEGNFDRATRKLEWLGQWYKFKSEGAHSSFIDTVQTNKLNEIDNQINWAGNLGMIPVVYTSAGIWDKIQDDASGLKEKISSKAHLFVAHYTTGTEPVMPMYFDKGSWRFWEYAAGKYRFSLDVLSQFEQYLVKTSAPGEEDPVIIPDPPAVIGVPSKWRVTGKIAFLNVDLTVEAQDE